MIYFDNGATTFPKPRRVLHAVREAMERYGANPGRSGHTLSMETAIKVYEAREALCELFHAEKPEDVVFTANCTHAVNLALKGLLREGDHVIISDLEHNAILRPVHALQQQGVITYSVAETFTDDERTTASFAAHIRPETRLIACTHASNVFGIRLPIERLGALCRERDLLFLVDAAQTAGVLDIDTRAHGIDFLCMAGHKSLYGPSGTGALITPLGSLLATIVEGGTGSYSADYDQPTDMPDRLESGTVNTAGIIGLGAGVDYVLDKGLDVIYEHEMNIACEIYRRLSEMEPVCLYTPNFAPGRHLPVISFNIEGRASEEVAAQLSDMGFALRGGLHCAPLAHKKMGTLETGAARISVGAFNTRAQAMQLCEAINRCCRDSE